MRIFIKKQNIPWAMVGVRAVLGPILIAGTVCQWKWFALVSIVLTALLSDIYDGILARRWQCDSPAIRLSDSMADTIFYLCTAFALWIYQPDLWQIYAAPLMALLGLEAMRFAFDISKFGKPASYHSYLAKTWGLVLAFAVVAVFWKRWSFPFVPLALGLGILCNVEGLIMSILLPVWRKDMKTLRAVWCLRRELLSEVNVAQDPIENTKQSLLGRVLVVGLACMFALPLFAVGEGRAVYISGTSPKIAKGTLGDIDTTPATSLVFHSTSLPAGDLEISYGSIHSFQYTTEVTRHLGVLPAIAVGLVRRRERRHFFSVSYVDVSGTAQAVVFEVPKQDPRGLLAILRARAPQACGKLTTYCGGSLP